MSVRRKSILTTEGFEESYVDIKKVIDKVIDPSKLGGVTKIHGTPDDQGEDFVIEEGKIYYDIDDEKYYLGGNEAYYQIPTIDDVVYAIQNNEEYWVSINEWPILAAPEQRKINGVSQPGCYDIRPFTLYTGGFNPASGTQGQSPTLDIALLDGSAVHTREYCFYYTQSGSTVPQISIHVNEAVTQVTVPDSVAELIAGMEDGHTYEFNIFNNVLLVSDITATQS